MLPNSTAVHPTQVHRAKYTDSSNMRTSHVLRSPVRPDLLKTKTGMSAHAAGILPVKVMREFALPDILEISK